MFDPSDLLFILQCLHSAKWQEQLVTSSKFAPGAGVLWSVPDHRRLEYVPRCSFLIAIKKHLMIQGARTFFVNCNRRRQGVHYCSDIPSGRTALRDVPRDGRMVRQTRGGSTSSTWDTNQLTGKRCLTFWLLSHPNGRQVRDGVHGVRTYLNL